MVAARPKPSATAVGVTKPFMVKVLLMFWRAAPSRWVGVDILHLCDSLRGSHRYIVRTFEMLKVVRHVCFKRYQWLNPRAMTSIVSSLS